MLWLICSNKSSSWPLLACTAESIASTGSVSARASDAMCRACRASNGTGPINTRLAASVEISAKRLTLEATDLTPPMRPRFDEGDGGVDD